MSTISSTQLNNKKAISYLVWLFTLVYTVSYITRINYGAVISEIESSTGIARSLLSMAVTGSFITYGVGQVISGILGDKVSPKKLVMCGLITTVLMNSLIPLCRSPYAMTAVWCVNGFAQSFMWPPLVRLMTALLSADDYKSVATKVVCGSSVGTIIVYLVSPLLISLAGWKAVFIFAALCGALMLIVWAKFPYDVQPQKKQPKLNQAAAQKGHLFTPVMLCIMVAIILHGMLRDGITTWMPAYISDTYNLSNIISILTGVILPIFGIVCMQLSSTVYAKWIKSPVVCAFVIFAIGAASSVILYFISGKSISLSVALMALLTGSMHGVNLCLVTMIPAFFKKYGNVSTVSGVINSCTYIGSAISTYGIALLSEKLGWNFTLFIWIVISVLGTLMCGISIKGWNKKHRTE